MSLIAMDMLKFKISPKAGLNEGTIVENFADIYFDFNEPIRTNTTFTNFSNYQLPENIRDIKLITSQEENIISKSIRIFPNPASATIKISYDRFKQHDWVLEIKNILGKTQKVDLQKINDNTLEINLEHLTPGIYLIHLQTSQGVGVKKILIE